MVARPHRQGRAAQCLHDPDPDPDRAGGRAGARRRQGALEGRGDRRGAGRDRARRAGGGRQGQGRLRGAAGGLRHRGGAEARRAAGQRISRHRTTIIYDSGQLPQGALRRRREGLRRGRPHPRADATSPRRSSMRRPRPPAASSCPRATTASPATPTRRRCSSRSTTPRSSCRCPVSKLHFVGGTVGGGFGGKVDVIVEPIAILAAMLTGRPVTLRLQPRGGDAGLLAARGRADRTSRTA